MRLYPLRLSILAALLIVLALSLSGGPDVARGQQTFTVTNTNDSGAGSLRQAILDANASPGKDTITFNIPGEGPHTITQPTAGLPTITDPVLVDGWSQPGFSGMPLIALRAGFTITVSNTEIRGLAMYLTDSWGVKMEGTNSSGNWIYGNFIGPDPTGSECILEMGFMDQGVYILDGAHHNTIGTNADGVNDAAEHNVISCNENGVYIWQGSYNVIAGNYIGTDVTGTSNLGNWGMEYYGYGVAIGPDSHYNRIGTNGDGFADEAERNIISGNGFGIKIYSEGGLETTYNVVAGNFIGPDVTGTRPPSPGRLGNTGNHMDGIWLDGRAKFNRIGTNGDGISDEAERNIISASQKRHGIELGLLTSGNIIAGNYIGTDVSGTLPLGNGQDGIYARGRDNIIGGESPNLIAFNGRTGITIYETYYDDIASLITHNSIHSNGDLGIDLSLSEFTLDGVTLNDPGDVDGGPNNLQNYPVLTAAAPTTIDGTLNSTPNTPFTLEFFSNIECDPSGYGEGEVFQATTAPATVTTDASGDATFSFTFTETIPEGRVITATATDPSGNTSEFSACVFVVDAINDPPVNTVPGAQSTDANAPLTFSAAAGNAISVSDPDAGANPVEVTLTATHGTLTLSGTTGLSFTAGDGTDDPTMTFTGTLAAINSALDGLVFTPEPGYVGPASLTITTNDQGYTGSGGPLTDTDVVNITVSLIPPAVPTLLAPGHKTTLNTTTPTLAWEAVALAASYEVQIATDVDFVRRVRRTTVTETSYTTDPLHDGQMYWWRVRAFNAGGESGPWSAARSFKIDTSAPPRPPRLTPPSGATISDPTPAFRWARNAESTAYVFQLAADEGFEIVLIEESLTRPRYDVSAPLLPGEYWWRVAAVDAADNVSEWSAASFTLVVDVITTPPPTDPPGADVPPTAAPPAAPPVLITPVPTQPPPPHKPGDPTPTPELPGDGKTRPPHTRSR
jgi:hypothetical protein